MVRSVGEVLDRLPVRHPGQHQRGAHPGLEPTHDVGVHPVADHHAVLRVRTEHLPGVDHHQGVRLADDVGLPAGGRLDRGQDRPRGRLGPALHRVDQVGVGADEPGATVDELRGLAHRGEREVGGLADDDVLRMALGDRVADLVELGGQAAAADDIGRGVRSLCMQELCRCDRRGDEVGLGQPVDAHPLELALEVQGGLLGVVGQEQEGDVVGPHVGDEVLGAGDELLAPVDDPIHVRDHAEPTHVHPFRRCAHQASREGESSAWGRAARAGATRSRGPP